MSSLWGRHDFRKALGQHRDDRRRVVHRKRRLGDVGERPARLRLERARIRLGLDQADRAGRQLPHGAGHLGVPGVADEHDLAAALEVDLRLAVDLGHQRAGGVEVEEVALPRFLRHRLADAVGGEDHRLRGRRNFRQRLDEDGALRLQAIDDVAVVHDLVAHVDRRPEFLQRQLDDLDRPVDAGAEAARAAEQDVEVGLRHGREMEPGRRRCQDAALRPAPVPALLPRRPLPACGR